MRGLVLTSSSKKIFSAGLDLMEMYNPEPRRLADFWRALQQLFLKLYMTPLVTIAAIEGHCPAGGCFLAMCTDFRVMTNTPLARIGLNETQVGIVAPFWFRDVAVSTMGQRQAELMLQLGAQYDGPTAMQLDLVDRCVDQDQVRLEAEREMKTWLGIPNEARIMTKQAMRRPLTEKLKHELDHDVETFTSVVTSATAQRALQGYVSRLKQK